MDAPSLWWLQDQYEIYQAPNNSFLQALIAQLVEHLTSDHETMSSNPTSGNDPISKKYNNLFNN